MQKMFQTTYPVGTKIVFKLNAKGDEAVGEVLFSSSLFMKVNVISECPLKDREVSVSPTTFVRVQGE